MEHDRIAEALAKCRTLESTYPKLARECNEALDDAIIAIRDVLGLQNSSGQCFCARAHYGRICTKI